jgi:hypothetical protein
MSKKVPTTSSPGEAERKRRTREHVIADLSVHHVEGLALKCGHTVQRIVADYGYDLWLATYSEAGEAESDYVLLQLKASDSLRQYELTQEEVFSFPVSAKDYRLWRGSLLPVFFILYDAQLEEAYWPDVEEHAADQQQEAKGKIVRLRIPRSHVLGVQTFRLIRQRKLQRAAETRSRTRRET